MIKLRDCIFAILLTGVLIAGGFFYAGWYHWEYLRPPVSEYHNQFTTMTGNNNTASPVLNPTPKEVKQKVNGIGVGVDTKSSLSVQYIHLF